jgi:DNA polymerase III gamma/tau subunit
MVDWNKALKPSSWDDVVGHDIYKGIIIDKLEHQSFPHLTIFSGQNGIGKSCMASMIAKSIVNDGKLPKEFKQEHSIIIKNMAELNGKHEAVDVLDEIFKYKSIYSKTIYILEEVQSLDPTTQQMPYLEPLTHIPDDVYIIMCTSQINRIISGIRSRAVSFPLELPTNSDCVELVHKIGGRIGIMLPSDDSIQLFVRLCGNIPRDIINYMELLTTDNALNSDNIKKFFKVYDNSVYINFLKAMCDESMNTYDFVAYMENLSSTGVNYGAFTRGFREFCLSALVQEATGHSNLLLTKDDRKNLKLTLNSIGESKFSSILNTLSTHDKVYNEQASFYFLVSLRNVVHSVTAKDIFSKNSELAEKSKLQTKPQLNLGTSSQKSTPIADKSIFNNDTYVIHDTTRFTE